jgi:hypothetical protein
MRRLVVNDWYMVDDYHRDTGDGADLYSVGKTRGCGGSGIWADGKLSVSKNFRNSRSLANGPVRVMFELEYEPWSAGAVTIGETKRITLDAGQNLDRFESIYTVTPAGAVEHASGIKKAAGARCGDRPACSGREPVKGASPGAASSRTPRRFADAEADGNLLVTMASRRATVVITQVSADRAAIATGSLTAISTSSVAGCDRRSTWWYGAVGNSGRFGV